MKRYPLYLLALSCLLLQPVSLRAQDEDEDDDTSIEVGEAPKGTAKEKPGDDEDAVRRKNRGQGLGGQGDDGDDEGAPKVKIPLQERINIAIKNGVEWLKKRQDKEGSWGPCRGNRMYGTNEKVDLIRDPTGPTSFAIYTLAKCGVKKTDPVIQRGLRWLKERTLVTFDNTGKKPGEKVRVRRTTAEVTSLTTYESASIVLLIEAVYQGSAKLTGKHTQRKLYTDKATEPPRKSKIPEDEWLWMHDRIRWLTAQTIQFGGGGKRGKSTTTRVNGTQNANGGWRYGQYNGEQDLSATQFVLLALRAASQAGYPLDKEAPDTFRWAANFVHQIQRGDGGFSYWVQEPSTNAGMTACGIGALLMCREQMALMEQEKLDWIDDSIERAMAHLDEVFSATENRGVQPGNQSHLYYYLYAVERAGDLSGRREFGGKSWYVRGAEFLLAHQDPDGKWVDSTAFPPTDALGTCYALLFLKRATPPAVTVSGD